MTAQKKCELTLKKKYGKMLWKNYESILEVEKRAYEKAERDKKTLFNILQNLLYSNPSKRIVIMTDKEIETIATKAGN